MDGIVLAFSHFDTGGLQTLMVRIAKWCNRNNISSLIMYETADDNMLRMCESENVECVKVENNKQKKICLEKFVIKHKTIKLITFELPEFLDYEYIRLKFFKTVEMHHLIYNVSVNGMIFGKNFKALLGKAIYQVYRNISKRIYFNNQVIFMDDETCESALNYYGIQDSRRSEKVFLLPMFVDKNVKHLFPEQRSILTVTRADFPYKGYVIGLIDDFAKLLEEFPDIELKIVAFGKDLDILKKKIEDQHDIVRNRIVLYDQLSLQEIKELLKKTYLYIGMGTTVLDAANEGVPTIVSWHSTMKNECNGLFHDNPRVVGRGKTKAPGEDIIRKVLLFDKEDYLKCSVLTYSEYVNNYDIDNVLPRLLYFTPLKKNVLKYHHFFFHWFLFLIRGIRRKVLRLK